MERDECCKDCRFFEPRNSFCRRNPPTPIVIDTDRGYSSNQRGGYNNSHKKDFIISKYPVISLPEVDWCGEFEDADEVEIL